MRHGLDAEKHPLLFRHFDTRSEISLQPEGKRKTRILIDVSFIPNAAF